MSAAEGWDVQASSQSDAHEAWSRMLSATHLPWSVTELSPDPPSGFSASVRRRHLADLMLVECTCSPNAGVRRSHELASTDGAYLVMLMTLCGHETVSQGDNVAQLSPGSVVVWDSERPAEFLVQDTLVKRSLLVPKSALAEVGGRGALRTGAVLDVSAVILVVRAEVSPHRFSVSSCAVSAARGERVQRNQMLGVLRLAVRLNDLAFKLALSVRSRLPVLLQVPQFKSMRLRREAAPAGYRSSFPCQGSSGPGCQLGRSSSSTRWMRRVRVSAVRAPVTDWTCRRWLL